MCKNLLISVSFINHLHYISLLYFHYLTYLYQEADCRALTDRSKSYHSRVKSLVAVAEISVLYSCQMLTRIIIINHNDQL